MKSKVDPFVQSVILTVLAVGTAVVGLRWFAADAAWFTGVAGTIIGKAWFSKPGDIARSKVPPVVAGLLGVAIFLTACGGSTPEPDAANADFCAREIKRLASRAVSPTCEVAVYRLADLAEQNPKCASILGDAGLHITCKDGGAQ